MTAVGVHFPFLNNTGRVVTCTNTFRWLQYKTRPGRPVEKRKPIILSSLPARLATIARRTLATREAQELYRFYDNGAQALSWPAFGRRQ